MLDAPVSGGGSERRLMRAVGDGGAARGAFRQKILHDLTMAGSVWCACGDIGASNVTKRLLRWSWR
ncbi:hypothetical protein KCP69_06390 [Salmonella enterica subsp. enterica]|nr:hypothetical protein KCP69_06390 [Salmonella enterica subsp. enterica]